MKISLPVVIVIVVVVFLGVYGSFYVYATSSIRPHDLKSFEEDLKNINGTTIPDSEINKMESLASQIETGPSIKELPPDQISTYSAAMKPNDTVKTNFEALNNHTTTNQAIATRYDLLLQGDIANEIRTAYNSKLVNLRKQMIQTQEKAATDFAEGDNAAVAADLKQYAQYAKEYNALTSPAQTSLEKIVTKLKT